MVFEKFQRQLTQQLELIKYPTRAAGDRNTNYQPLGSPGHRRNVSISSFNPRKAVWLAGAALFVGAVLIASSTTYIGSKHDWRSNPTPYEEGSPIPLGKSVYTDDGTEIFWWSQFPDLIGYYRGRKDIVLPSEYTSEQEQKNERMPISGIKPGLIHSADSAPEGTIPCSFTPPVMPAYNGLPQGMSDPLLGSMEEMGMNPRLCYDRVHRYGPYGLDIPVEQGGLGIELHGENDRDNHLDRLDYSKVKWNQIQEECVQKNQEASPQRSRTAFIIRTWHTFKYTPHHILMLRAIVNELSMRSGGQVYVHFLIHVQDDSLPIWASQRTYQEVLKESLPPEFEGMGTLWSVAQMKLIYPPPFPMSIINFSGGDVYEAYRSLHFPLQYFASQHQEFDYFWEWEMDIRVTGNYGELLDKVTSWADKQARDHLWERSSRFFIPSLYNNSYDEFSQAIVETTAAARQKPISGPQLPQDQLLPIPDQRAPGGSGQITDLITFSPLFDPSHTRWAFKDDITGYGSDEKHRPPTRAALITASRLSRRLLLLMHQETYRHKHTMFPEMYPASIALHYGLKAVYAPITTYFDRNWPAEHANEIFNNAKLSPSAITAGMDNGANFFHAPGGSVFGPGEHVFRGATWYSNALFAGYLWRRWLGNENNNGEIEWEFGEGHGRMCLPMMVLHPIKEDG